MQLPSLFGHTAASSDHFFLSMFIADGILQAGLWAVEHNQVAFLSQSEIHHYETPDGAINQADEAFQELGPESEKAKKIVFGFDPGWIDQNGVHADRKTFLKKLTTDLNLEPVGFVSLTESVLQQLISGDLMMSSVVMILHGQQLFGYLVKQGKILTQVDVSRSTELLTDAKEIITKLAKTAKSSGDYLPAEIKLASTGTAEAELLAQHHTLTNHTWVPEFPFVQSPKFEILPNSFVIEAVTTQGGIAVAKSRGLMTVQSPVVARDLDNSGPVKSQTAEVQPAAKPEAEFNSVPEETAVAAAMSFGVPVKQTSPEFLAAAPTVDPEFVSPEMANPHPDSFVAFPHSKHPLMVKKVVVLSILAGLVTVILAGFILLWSNYKVQITLQPTLLPVAKDARITLDPKAVATDPENLVLKAELTKKDLTDSDTLATTGVKLVGDKASGVIKVFNKTASLKTFSKGTELSAGTIKFTLQDDVQVASASVIQNGAESETRDYGEAEAKVDAVDIGADANLAKDTALKIASFDTGTYTAIVKEGLTGGSSREVRVVAAEDKAKLQKALLADLTAQAQAAFKSESSDGKYLMATGRVLQSTTKFDAEVGKEAETLGLELTATFEGLQYTREDLKPIIIKVLGGELKPGYVLPETDPQFMSEPEQNSTASSSGKIVLAVNIATQSEPQISTNELSQQLVGLNLSQAEAKLKSMPVIKESQIDFTPVLARWLVGKMPSQAEKITIIVAKKN